MQRLLGISILVVGFIFTAPAYGQKEEALSYLERISEEYEQVVKAQWDYALAIAGEKNRNRQQQSLDAAITRAINGIHKIPPYHDDSALRDSVVSFLDMNHRIIREDYRNVSDMNSLEDHSMQDMQAFLYEQEQNYQRLSELSGHLKKEEEKFARKHGVHLVTREDKFSKKFEKLNELLSYYNATYMDFFKVYRQELLLFRHIESRNADSISVYLDRLSEQAVQHQRSFSKRGGYEGDKSLVKSALAMLTFYEEEANDLQIVRNYYEMIVTLNRLKKDRGNGAKNAEEYNAQARKINESTDGLNKVNEKLNDQRAILLHDWNVESAGFLSRHIH